MKNKTLAKISAFTVIYFPHLDHILGTMGLRSVLHGNYSAVLL